MEVGIAPPPPGVTPNFNPPYTDVQVSLIASTAVFLFLSTGTLALRLYTSISIARKCELDDVFITLAWATSVGFSALQMNALQYGWGKHTWDTSATQLQRYMTHVNPMASTYMLSPTLAKLAILTLYYRIHPGRTIRTLVLAVGACIVVYTVVLVVILTVPCNIIVYGNNACFQNSAIAHGFLNVIFDVVLIILPLPVIWNLNMPMRQKLIVGMIFGIGSGAIIASIGRTVVVQELAPLPDFTYYQPKTGIWSTAELNLCIVCNCLTRLRPFLKRHFPRAAISWGSNGKSGSGGGGGGGGSNLKPWAPSGQGSSGSWNLATIGSKRSRQNTKGIQITREYHIDSSHFDGGSTENIVGGGRESRAT